jgi:hypothetical protein
MIEDGRSDRYRREVILNQYANRVIEFATQIFPSTYDIADIKGTPFVKWTLHNGLCWRRYLRKVYYAPYLFAPKAWRYVTGIHKSITPQGVAFYVLACLKRYGGSGEGVWNARAEQAYDILLSLAREAPGGIGWGLPFPFHKKTITVAPWMPVAHTTVWCGDACLETYLETGQVKIQHILKRVANYLINGLNYTDHGENRLSVSYTHLDEDQVINIAGDVASFLLRAEPVVQSHEAVSIAKRLLRFVVENQNVDGSWYYYSFDWNNGPSEIDVYHTCMVLRALAESLPFIQQDANLHTSVVYALDRGFRFFESHMIRKDGLPKTNLQHSWPVNSYACAEAIRALRAIAKAPALSETVRLQAQALSNTVIKRTLERLIYANGRVVTVDYGIWRMCVDSLRWSQAYMALVLQEVVCSPVQKFQ